MQVGVVGLGNWGTALAQHLALCGHDCLGWSNCTEIVEGINSAHTNPQYLTSITLSPALKATGDLNAVLARDILVVALPSAALDTLTWSFSGRPLIISATKGIDPKTNLTPLEFFETKNASKDNLVVLSGPSFAIDLASGRPIGLVAASKSDAAAKKTAELFKSERVKVYLSHDPLGVEIGGIVKNIVAIAVGVSDGLGFGDSARAGLITRGLAEIVRLAESLGADSRTIFGLSGLGDLAMTASSDTSRNRTVGLRLGRGESLQHITASLGSVAEGVTATPLVLELAKRYGVEMPIATQVARLLRGESTPAETVKALMGRPTKHEF